MSVPKRMLTSDIMVLGRDLVPGDLIFSPPVLPLPPLPLPLPLPLLPPQLLLPRPPPDSFFIVSVYPVNEDYASRYCTGMVPGSTRLYRFWLNHAHKYKTARDKSPPPGGGAT